jgi:RNA-directed DNA polymerase
VSKADGTQRPLGIPTFEDKIAQRAIAMVLEAVYEQDFLPCSYGFRPGRSAHQALHTLRSAIWSQRLHWVLDVDIQKYLDFSSDCPPVDCRRREEVGWGVRHLDS